ncbi:hypothetical protein ACO2Q1_08935 [Brevundimonas sp. VNH65]|uniref:hypothetical protein n=1 Tax=Brevundimonas sp. VNH65 TaxID=3400917 RepID=UPI003C060F89
MASISPFVSLHGQRVITLVSALVFACLSTSELARAQSAPQHIDQGVKVASIRSADQDGVWTIDIFSGVDLTRPIRPDRYPLLYSARFRRGNSGLRDRWADTQTCPALIGVVAGLDAVFAPRFNPGRAYGLPPEGARMPESTPPPLHAQGYTIEGRAVQADGSTAQMSISSNGGAIAAFGKLVETRLANCWAERQPAL